MTFSSGQFVWYRRQRDDLEFPAVVVHPATAKPNIVGIRVESGIGFCGRLILCGADKIRPQKGGRK